MVYTILETCQETGAPHPVVVSEFQAAPWTAHHAVLVLPVIDVVGPTWPP